jgi:hypothetical protein
MNWLGVDNLPELATSAALPRLNIPGFHWYAAGGAALACLLLCGVPPPHMGLFLPAPTL